MRCCFFRRSLLCLVITGSLGAAGLMAQPPGPKGKGPKGPPGPQPGAEFVRVRGTVTDLTTAPKGEIDGLMLDSGKWVHWPPHLTDRFTAIVAKGDKVEASGYVETDPKGGTKVEISTLTNLRTKDTRDNPDRPAPPKADVDRGGGDALTVNGTIKEFTTAPKGEVDGLMLSDGTWVHWPPHLAERFTGILAKGDKIKVTGVMGTGPKGDTKLEVSTVTNLRTNRSIENPDRPLPAAGRAGAVEDRLRALEDRLEELSREIQRLRGKK
jgi:hypothetical protein